MTDPRVVALVLAITVCPLAVVAIVALVRGYSVSLTMRRDTRRHHDDDR